MTHRIALSIASLHSLTTLLGTVTLAWMVQTNLAIAPGASQIPPLLPDPGLEDTQQRLRDRNIPDLQFPETPDDPNVEFNLYRLGIGDAIAVNVLRFPDLSFQAAIDLEGNITVPLLGKIPLVGLTLEQAQERIRFGLNRYVIDPVVLLNLASPRPVKVTVTGEVVKPGFYPVAGGLPLLSQILQQAGGATQQADLRKVLIRRPVTEGEFLEKNLDFITPLAQGEPPPDLRLQDGDVVFVEPLDPNDPDYDRALAAASNISQQAIAIQVLSYPGSRVGTVTLPNGSTFVEALGSIGISPDVADLRDVVLIRFDPNQGKPVTYHFNAKRAIFGDPSQDIALQDRDVIVVGRNLISRITYALNTFTQPFRDILGFTLFFQQLQNSVEGLFFPAQGTNGNSN